MDRTIAITRFNTEEIAMEVDKVIKKGLDKLLGDHLYRYELLEKTHEAIMNLPSIRNHLNQSPYEYTPYDFVKEYNSSNKLKVDTNELDIKYGALLEKLITRIDNLTDEINKLKCKSVKDVVDLTTDEIQIKLEYPIKIEQQVKIIEDLKSFKVRQTELVKEGRLSAIDTLTSSINLKTQVVTLLNYQREISFETINLNE